MHSWLVLHRSWQSACTPAHHGWPTSGLRQDDDLSVEVPGTAGIECCCRLCQRKGPPDGDGEPPLLEKGDDLAQRRAPIILCCADEDLNSGVGGVERDECQNTVGATGEFNRERNLATAGRIKDGIDPVWRNGADTFEEAVAVGDGLGANRSQVLEIALTRRTNYPCPARDRELNRERTHPTGGGVYEQRLARLNAQLVKHGPRGAARAGHAAGHVPADVRGFGYEVGRICKRGLGDGGRQRAAHHLIAHL